MKDTTPAPPTPELPTDAPPPLAPVDRPATDIAPKVKAAAAGGGAGLAAAAAALGTGLLQQCGGWEALVVAGGPLALALIAAYFKRGDG